jgi:hypothetical protein
MSSARIVVKPSDPLIQTLEMSAGLTVNDLLAHLQELIARDPATAACTVMHTEFGMMRPSLRVGINVEKGKVFIG